MTLASSALNDRTAIITGGGQGMGLAVALKLAALGANIAVNDIDPARADSAAAKEVAADGITVNSVCPGLSSVRFICGTQDHPSAVRRKH